MFKPLVIAGAFLSLASNVWAQSAVDEASIRSVEQQMADALISGDTAVIARLLNPAFVVNSPANVVTDGAAMLGMVQSGFISYSAYEKARDRITFIGDLKAASPRILDSALSETADPTLERAVSKGPASDVLPAPDNSLSARNGYAPAPPRDGRTSRTGCRPVRTRR